MSYENILLEIDNNIAVITINRPKALNALNSATLTELAQALDEIEKSEAAEALIISGQGEKAFVAGADIAFMKDLNPIEAREFAILGQKLMSKIENFPKPVIAAVNGFALGGGCELAMSCDIRIASENAKFGQPEVGLGIIPGFAGTQRLSRLVGKGVALQLMMTGEQISAQRAFEIGLVNEVIPISELMPRAKTIAARITANSPFAVRLVKEAVNNGLEMEINRAIAFEAELFALCFTSPEQKEGMTAFLEKRKPKYRN
ncbi:MAG: enoyl-CoA hydratase-related protein [Bacillota bacterium]